MSDVQISVRGAESRQAPAEQAVVHLEVSTEEAAMPPAFDRTAASLAAVTQSLQALTDGPVASYSADQVRTSAYRPWRPDDQPSELVYQASASVTATFTDFAALGVWVSETAAIDGVNLGEIQWQLTPANALAADREARTAAVLDARTRAQDYADALGLGTVAVLSVSDPGVRSTPQPAARMMKATADAGAPQVEFTPQSVEISAYVEAVFVVEG